MEFFLLVPLVILVLVLGMQVVRVTLTHVELVGAARDGARVAATTPDPSRAVEAVLGALPPELRSRVRVSVSRPSVVGQAARVEVRLRHLFAPPFPGGAGVDLTARASMLVER